MIYLLRHGEDNEDYIGGWSDVCLTKKGIKQVKDTISLIKSLKIKQIYASDILRAEQTAMLVANELNISVKLRKEFRELNKGDLTGMLVATAKKEYPTYFNLDIYTRYPNGESMIDLYNRVKQSLYNLNDESLIVTHRGYINMIYFILNDRIPDMNKTQFDVEHASLHELDLEYQKIKRIK